MKVDDMDRLLLKLDLLHEDLESVKLKLDNQQLLERVRALEDKLEGRRERMERFKAGQRSRKPQYNVKQLTLDKDGLRKPATADNREGFPVTRVVDGKLLYYGTYQNERLAERITVELEKHDWDITQVPRVTIQLKKEGVLE